MTVIKRFGAFSGLVINWSKSSIMLLDAAPYSQSLTLHDIPVVSKFKYLVVYVTPQPHAYISLNLSSLLGLIRDKTKI